MKNKEIVIDVTRRGRMSIAVLGKGYTSLRSPLEIHPGDVFADVNGDTGSIGIFKATVVRKEYLVDEQARRFFEVYIGVSKECLAGPQFGRWIKVIYDYDSISGGIIDGGKYAFIVFNGLEPSLDSDFFENMADIIGVPVVRGDKSTTLERLEAIHNQCIARLNEMGSHVLSGFMSDEKRVEVKRDPVVLDRRVPWTEAELAYQLELVGASVVERMFRPGAIPRGSWKLGAYSRVEQATKSVKHAGSGTPTCTHVLHLASNKL